MVTRKQNPWGFALHEVRSRFYTDETPVEKQVVEQVRKQQVTQQSIQQPIKTTKESAWHRWKKSLKNKGL